MIWMKRSALVITTILPISIVVSCSSAEEQEKIDEKVNELSGDEGIIALQEEFEGKINTDDELEIVFNKIEVKDQFEVYVEAFNEVFGTQLKATVVGGSQTIDSVVSSKFGSTDTHNILLTAATTPEHFDQYSSRYVSTEASEMLNLPDLQDDGQLEFGDNQVAMSAASEGFGLIYNKSKFEEWNIVVHEGQDTPESTSNDIDGVYETDNGIEIYTNDLTADGFDQLEDYLENKDIQPYYPLSKASSGEIWTMTNHLVGVAISLNVDEKDYGSDNFEDIYNDDMISAVHDALIRYGHEEDYNESTNTIDQSLANVAIGGVAMVQNGTWNNEALIEYNEDDEFGILPMPVFNEEDKAVVTKSYSLWWARTDITEDNEENLNTAKLFLQALYTTNIGVETLINDLSFNTPFPTSEVGITEEIDFSGNQLFESLNNYSENIASSDDQLPTVVLNNDIDEMSDWIRSGAPSSGTEYDDLHSAWDDILNL